MSSSSRVEQGLAAP